MGRLIKFAYPIINYQEGMKHRQHARCEYVKTVLVENGYIVLSPVQMDLVSRPVWVYRFIKYMAVTKIMHSDICVVVDPDHIDGMTKFEILCAKELGKTIYSMERYHQIVPFDRDILGNK